MNILFVSSEVFPFAKTGGLADVLGALPNALSKRGHGVSIILPFYRCVREEGFTPGLFKKDIPLIIDSKIEVFDLYRLGQGEVNVYFVKRNDYYDREQLYGTPKGDYTDNALRFGFFSKAVIASLPHLGRLDIVHCNDWQSALTPLYAKLFRKQDPGFKKLKFVFTIHNMAYQGIFEKNVLKQLGLPSSIFSMDGLEFYGRLNFMKAGIIYSDVITTVSKGYSREILTKEFGCGLDGLLRTRKDDIHGILNGVDYSVWNPRSDKFIVKQYGRDDLSGKLECKKDLLKEFDMSYHSDRLLIGMISRLAEQKGVDIVAASMDGMIDLGTDFVLLGFGDEKYNDMFRGLSERYKGRVGVRIGFDNALAHKIEAGCDIFFMPSRYEPCGLNQLYSMKYATVPVVRAVGGLDDTVEGFDYSTKKGNGFKFRDAASESLIASLKDAAVVLKDRGLRKALLYNCLSCDFSWDSSAKRYEDLYNELAD